MAALLRTDDDRGPLVAAGLLVLAVAVFLTVSRFASDWAAGARLVVAGVPALLALGVAFYTPLDEVPRPWVSVILVVEFALVFTTLGQLADALGASSPFGSSGTVTWVGLLVTLLAAFSARRHNSAVMTLIAGVAATVTALAFIDWAFDLAKPLRTYRWLLMLGAIGLGGLGLALRGARPRHGVALIDVAGLVVLGLALTFAVEAVIGAFSSAFGGGSSSGSGWGWELFVLLAGAALVWFAVSNREPGPGYLGALNLLAFTVLAAGTGKSPSFIGWPLVLFVVALAVLAFALRPRLAVQRAE